MLEKITSRDNQKVKFARSVREGKERDLIFIEGVRLAEEALRSKANIRQAFFAEDFAANQRNRELAEKIEERVVETFELSGRSFQSLADTVSAQGIILIAQRPKSALESIEKRLNEQGVLPLVLFLHEVSNPSNLGAILRTAEAAGVAGVIISAQSADVFSPKSLRASMGAAFRVPVESDAEFEEVLEWAGSSRLTTTAADVEGKIPHTGVDWRRPRLLIFGSEAHGLANDQLENIQELTFIPMRNEVESLNLAVSSGIILFEAVRQNSNG